MLNHLIIFDCDGVLVDSEYIVSRLFAQTLSSYGYDISLEECIKRFTGIDEDRCREVIMQESNVVLPSNYWSLQKTKVKQAYESELTALLQPVLEMLQSRKIPICIASNSARSDIIHCLECTKQMPFFSEETIFSAAQVAKPKPSPDLFLFAAKTMGIKAENCIVIEDSAAGAKAATAAGMPALLFLGGTHARFDWYHDQMLIHNKPMLATCEELKHALQNIIK